MADATPIPIEAPSTDAPYPAGLDASVAKAFGSPAVADPQDPYANLDRAKLLERFKKAKDEGLDLRWVYERQWWRNLLYTLGRQWIFFDTKRGEWRDKRLQKWIPRPVTDKCRNGVLSIRAIFSAIKLGIIARPNGQNAENIVTANIADEMHPLLHEEHDADKVWQDADFWSITCGNSFLKLWWDKDLEHGTKTIIVERCTACGAELDTSALENTAQPICPECGGTEFEQTPEEVAVGKGRTDAVSPFEVLLPSHASDFESEVRKIIRLRWRPRDYWESNYDEWVKSNKLAWEKAPTERSLQLFKSLASQNDITSVPFATSSGGTANVGEGLTEYEYWEKPSKEYPEGLFFRVAGDSAPQILEDPGSGSPGPLPERDKDDKPLWTWIHMPYEPFGGRVWAMGAVDPVVQKIDQLNQHDSLVQLIVQRMANPIWLEPKGAEVEKFTGEPGLVVKYLTVGPTGAKPERIPGEGPHPTLFQLREQYTREIEEAFKTYDIIKGQKPTGVEAFSALQLLVERSQSGFATVFNERGRAYRKWYSLALELERSYGPDERVQALMGPNRTWSFRHFQKAKLRGSISIVVEDGTNVPKTALGKRAAIEQANQLGLIDPADPDQRYQIMSDFGLQHLVPSLDSDVKSALEEQDAMERWLDSDGLDPETGAQIPPPLVVLPLIHNPIVHFQENRKWLNTDRMREWMRKRPELIQLFTEHLLQHQTEAMAMQAAQAQAGAGGGGGDQGRGKGAGGGQAMNNSNRESGSTDNVPRGSSERNQGQGPQ